MNRLYKKYQEKIIPYMAKTFSYKNKMAVPKIKKVVLNVGIPAENLNDDKFVKAITKSLEQITGQKPVFTRAKKSISAFKVKQGMKVGAKVTLRGKRMYDFIDKLVNITLPRVRDFRGLDKDLVTGGKSLTIGFIENVVFPEINSEKIERMHGLEVTIVSNAEDNKEMLALLTAFGFPFKKDKDKNNL
ncbi:MAG: 50S ribosomal protein L5 [Patescibacteria group bacterium]|nr:50S ribosomal protein L5 [Patescibacteria group bacterium]